MEKETGGLKFDIAPIVTEIVGVRALLEAYICATVSKEQDEEITRIYPDIYERLYKKFEGKWLADPQP